MNKIVYLNGEFLEESRAKVSIFDRGFIFGDGIYEVVPIVKQMLLDVEPFFERLERSLKAVKIDFDIDRDWILHIFKTLIEKNNIKEGGVYLQITRGIAKRDFAFIKGLKPTIMAFGFEKEIINSKEAKNGIKVATTKDLRWKRRDIKSISLLAQCMAKNEAVQKGAFEGWMIEDGYITEGTSSTAYIVKNNTIITRALSNSILPGIRRKVLLELLENENDINIEQRAFTLDEALDADEAFLSSATTFILPIVTIDDHTIGDGKPGEITKKLREKYIKHALNHATLLI